MSAADFTFQPNVTPHITALMFPSRGAHNAGYGRLVWTIPGWPDPESSVATPVACPFYIR